MQKGLRRGAENSTSSQPFCGVVSDVRPCLKNVNHELRSSHYLGFSMRHALCGDASALYQNVRKAGPLKLDVCPSQAAFRNKLYNCVRFAVSVVSIVKLL